MGRPKAMGAPATVAELGHDGLPPGATYLDHRTVEERRGAFLAALRESFTATAAAKKAGIHRGTPYTWRRDDAAFAGQWDAALAEGRALTGALLEDKMLDLALNTDNPLPGFFLLKEIKPTYRDSYQAPAPVPQRRSLRFLTDEERDAVVQGAYRLLPEHTPEEASDG